MLLRQEKEDKLSTTYKKPPFTVVQENGNSVLVEADGVRWCTTKCDPGEKVSRAR